MGKWPTSCVAKITCCPRSNSQCCSHSKTCDGLITQREKQTFIQDHCPWRLASQKRCRTIRWKKEIQDYRENTLGWTYGSSKEISVRCLAGAEKKRAWQPRPCWRTQAIWEPRSRISPEVKAKIWGFPQDVGWKRWVTRQASWLWLSQANSKRPSNYKLRVTCAARKASRRHQKAGERRGWA